MKTPTNICHIVQFTDNTIYLYFLGCGWKCKACLRLMGWDNHIPPSDIKSLNKTYPDKTKLKLTMCDAVKILKENNAKKLYLGGYEPTADPNIEKILKVLKDNGFLVKVVTNGEFLNERIMESVDEVTLSIKALDDEIHRAYTGASNRGTLKNFERFHNSEKLEVESIFIPGLVECEEILKIAAHIANYNKNLRYRLDRFYSCNGYKRSATEEEVGCCLKKVMEILPNAYTFKFKKGKRDYARCLYPKLLKKVLSKKD